MAQATGRIDRERPDLAVNTAADFDRKQGVAGVFQSDPGLFVKPDYYVYIFSVADRSFDVSRPGLNISKITMGFNPEAIKNSEAYAVVWKIGHPYQTVYGDPFSGELRANNNSAERIAMDLCNPNNPTTDLDMHLNEESIIGYGDNLIAKGLFFVRDSKCKFDADGNPIPPKEEVAKAVARKQKYYNSILDKFRGLERSSPKELQDWLSWEPDAHLACEYFSVETSWHLHRQQTVVPVECLNCGSDIKRGVAFHAIGNSICVLDWDKAIAAGAVKESDRPVAVKK